jgi:hypothetical protein
MTPDASSTAGTRFERKVIGSSGSSSRRLTSDGSPNNTSPAMPIPSAGSRFTSTANVTLHWGPGCAAWANSSLPRRRWNGAGTGSCRRMSWPWRGARRPRLSDGGRATWPGAVAKPTGGPGGGDGRHRAGPAERGPHRAPVSGRDGGTRVVTSCDHGNGLRHRQTHEGHQGHEAGSSDRPARPRSQPDGPSVAVRSRPGRPNPTRDRPAGRRPPAFTADGPGDPTGGRRAEDRPGRAIGKLPCRSRPGLLRAMPQPGRPTVPRAAGEGTENQQAPTSLRRLLRIPNRQGD